MRSIFFVFYLVLSFDFANADVVVENAWVKLPPPGVNVLAGYFDITNRLNDNVEITNARSPHFETIELHRNEFTTNGVSMVQIESLMLPPNKTISFSPGKDHLMLYHPKQSLKENNQVEIIFQTKAGKIISFKATVKTRAAQTDQKSTENQKHIH